MGTRRQPAGRSIAVTVAELGREARAFVLRQGATVQEALDAAHINGTAGDVRMNGQEVKREARLLANCVVTIVPKVKGGA